MESDMTQALEMIAEVIEKSSQPGWIEYLAIVISVVSVLVSVIAIVVAVQVPKQISVIQEELLKRQIKVETFGYKLKYAKNLYDLKHKIGLLQVLFSIEKLRNDSFSELYYRYSTLDISYSDIIVDLEHAKNIYTSDSTKFFEDIQHYFTTINELFCKFKIYGNALTSDRQKKREKEKVSDLNKIKHAVSCILYDLKKVIQIINDDMRISDVHIMK